MSTPGWADHLPWVVPVIIAMAGMFITIDHKLVTDGEARIQKLEMQIEQLQRYCCHELDGVGH